MRQSFRLGRIAGINVGVNWSVVVIAALLAFGLYDGVLPTTAPGRSSTAYLVAALIVAVAFFGCLLAHELAHALVARRFGISVPRITLWLLGGVSELDGEPRTPGAELLIAGAGPITSLLLGGLAAGVAVLTGASGLVGVCLAWLAGVNLILGVFNLLPGAPLDGGRVVHAALWRLRGDRVAAQIAADRAGIGLGLILATIGLVEVLFAGSLSGLWLVLLAWFLISAANAESQGVRIHAALAGLRVRDLMAPEPVCGFATQTIDAFVQNVAAASRHRVFPVVDLNGHLQGIVHLSDLVRAPAEVRASRRIGEFARRPDAAAVVGPDDPAEKVATALGPWASLVPVVEGGRLIGVVSAGDLARAVELASLRSGLAVDPVVKDEKR